MVDGRTSDSQPSLKLGSEHIAFLILLLPYLKVSPFKTL